MRIFLNKHDEERVSDRYLEPCSSRQNAFVPPHRDGRMTRGRALTDGTPSDISADYYARRAGLGLLITECTQPSEDGQGYLNTPGIHTGTHVGAGAISPGRSTKRADASSFS
jgi:hypothetical protein